MAETWIIKDNASGEFATTQIAFTSNGQKFTSIGAVYDGSVFSLQYGNNEIAIFTPGASSGYEFYNEAYRKLTFDTPPAGALLTWLQANGVKQPDDTAVQDTKAVTITSNGTVSVTPDAPYDGLSSVDVTVNVASGGGGGLIKIQNIVKSREIIGDGPAGSSDTITFDVVNDSEYSNNDLLIEFHNWNAGSIYDDEYTTKRILDATQKFFRRIGSEVSISKISYVENGKIATITLPFYASGTEGVSVINSGCIIITPDLKNSDGFSFLVRDRQCFVENTSITLSDGSIKPIQDVTYNDELLVWDFYTGQFTIAKPNWIKVEEVASEYNKLTFADGRTLSLVGNGNCINSDRAGYHRIFNKQAGAFTHTGTPDTPNGTITFTDDGKELELVSQEVVHDTVKFYNLTTDKYYNCFANGILTSCRLSNEYRIEDMKYVGERLLSDKDIDAWYSARTHLTSSQRASNAWTRRQSIPVSANR